MRNEVPVVPLCSSLEAFEVFSRYVEKGLSDFAGQPIEIDYGNYTHIMEDEERLERTPWVGPLQWTNRMRSGLFQSVVWKSNGEGLGGGPI